MNYATKKYGRRGRLCWANRLPIKNDRLESAVEASRGSFFSATAMLILPGGEILAADIFERGKRLIVQGRYREITVASGVLWDLAEAMRKADKR